MPHDLRTEAECFICSLQAASRDELAQLALFHFFGVNLVPFVFVYYSTICVQSAAKPNTDYTISCGHLAQCGTFSGPG